MDLRDLAFKQYKGVYYALTQHGYIKNNLKNKKGTRKVWAWVLMDCPNPSVATVAYYPSEMMRLDQCIEHFLQENCRNRRP